MPSPETAETRPLSHYGMSKMAGEGYCHLYGRLYGTEAAVLRLGNVYGPRQDPHGEAGVVAIFCGRMLDGERAHASSATACRRATTSTWATSRAPSSPPRPAPPGETVNIGAGVEVTVLDLLEGLGYEGEAEFAPARAGRAAAQRARRGEGRAALRLGGARPRCTRAWATPCAVGHRGAYRRRTPAPPGPSRRRDLGGPHRPALQHRRRALVDHPAERLAARGRWRRPPPAAPRSRSGGRQGPAEWASRGDEVGRARRPGGRSPRAWPPGRARRGTSRR